MAEQRSGRFLPTIATGPFAASGSEGGSLLLVKNQFFESRGQLRRPIRWYKNPRDSVTHRLRNSSDIVSDDGKSMRSGFEIDEAEALDAVAMIDAGHREDVGPVVNRG